MLSLSRGILPKYTLSKGAVPHKRTKLLVGKFLSRDYKAEASELKIGDVIEHKSKLVEITKIQHNFGAQRSASMQAEYKDIRTGNKGTDRFRVSEDVEIVELDWKQVSYEGEKDGELEFTDEAGETLMLPPKFFEGKLPWLKPGVEVQVRTLEEGEPLYYRWANRYQNLEIVSTKEVEQITPRGKPAVLSNGVIVKVPIFLQNGAWIKVDVITEEYIEKLDGPPADEEDD